MSSNLNPNAKEFVPVGLISSNFEDATKVSPLNMEARNHHICFNDKIITESPKKNNAINMSNIILPSQNNFNREIFHRPRSGTPAAEVYESSSEETVPLHANGAGDGCIYSRNIVRDDDYDDINLTIAATGINVVSPNVYLNSSSESYDEIMLSITEGIKNLSVKSKTDVRIKNQVVAETLPTVAADNTDKITPIKPAALIIKEDEKLEKQILYEEINKNSCNLTIESASENIEPIQITEQKNKKPDLKNSLASQILKYTSQKFGQIKNATSAAMSKNNNRKQTELKPKPLSVLGNIKKSDENSTIIRPRTVPINKNVNQKIIKKSSSNENIATGSTKSSINTNQNNNVLQMKTTKSVTSTKSFIGLPKETITSSLRKKKALSMKAASSQKSENSINKK